MNTTFQATKNANSTTKTQFKTGSTTQLDKNTEQARKRLDKALARKAKSAKKTAE